MDRFPSSVRLHPRSLRQRDRQRVRRGQVTPSRHAFPFQRRLSPFALRDVLGRPALVCARDVATLGRDEPPVVQTRRPAFCGERDGPRENLARWYVTLNTYPFATHFLIQKHRFCNRPPAMNIELPVLDPQTCCGGCMCRCGWRQNCDYLPRSGHRASMPTVACFSEPLGELDR